MFLSHVWAKKSRGLEESLNEELMMSIGGPSYNSLTLSYHRVSISH